MMHYTSRADTGPLAYLGRYYRYRKIVCILLNRFEANQLCRRIVWASSTVLRIKWLPNHTANLLQSRCLGTHLIATLPWSPASLWQTTWPGLYAISDQLHTVCILARTQKLSWFQIIWPVSDYINAQPCGPMGNSRIWKASVLFGDMHQTWRQHAVEFLKYSVQSTL